ncbi:MAG: 50S ribosomal protein L35, partial [Actinomycetota bacterium]
AKRFRVTRNGKVLRRRANLNHMLGKKTSRRKRNLAAPTAVVSESDSKRIRRMLGK